MTLQELCNHNRQTDRQTNLLADMYKILCLIRSFLTQTTQLSAADNTITPCHINEMKYTLDSTTWNSIKSVAYKNLEI